MAIVKYTNSERDLLARIMRAEALSEGNLGMLMVGNVVVNRVIADCHTFRNIDNIYDAVYQANQFSGTSNSIFYSSPTTREKALADRVIRGEYFHPATNALWFYAPQGGANCQNTWYDQNYAGRYKNHCFYQPLPNICREIH